MKNSKYAALLFCITLFVGFTAADSYIVKFEGDTTIEAEYGFEEPSLSERITGAFVGTVPASAQESRELREDQIKQKQVEMSQYLSENDIGEISANYSKVFNGVAVKNVDEDQLEELKSFPHVQEVTEDKAFNIQLEDSREIVGAEEVWEEQVNEENVTGKGISVAVIDTGVDYTHSNLGDCEEDWEPGACEKVPQGYDFVNNEEDPMDDEGHGTHVAGISSAEGDVQGIAPDSEIYAYKALDEEGSGFLSDIIDSIDQAVEDDADIITLSLGAGGDPDDDLSEAVDNAVQDGVVVSSSAGNDGPEQYSISSPATARKALSVGATDKDDELADFSSRGPVEWEDDDTGEEKMILKPSLTAPGSSIESTQLGGGTTIKSGTSMAAPMVSGGAALILQKNEGWGPTQVKSIMMNTALDSERNGFEVGTGRMNLTYTFNAPPIATTQPAINFKDISNSNDIEETFEVQNLHDEELEVTLSTTNAKDLFSSSEYSTFDLDKDTLQLDAGQTETVTLSISSKAQEGTYYGFVNIEDDKTDYTRNTITSFNQTSTTAEIELHEPFDEETASGETSFEFTVNTDSDETGEVELKLNDTVVENFDHEGGEETYSSLELHETGKYEWEVEYTEDSTVSELREIEFEDTGMEATNFNPENNTEFSFEDRNITFSTDLDLDHDTEARLIINNNEVYSEQFGEGTHTLEVTEELDPGSYDWNIELESINTGYVQETDERTFNVSEANIETELIEPETESAFSVNDTISFEVNTSTEEDAEVEVLVNESVIGEDSVSSGENTVVIEETFEEVGKYNWYSEVTGLESGETNTSEERTFRVENDFIMRLIEPENEETVYWNDTDIDFLVEVDSEEDATYELYVNNELEGSELVNSEDKPENITFNYDAQETGDFEWYVKANSEESDEEEETFTRSFEVVEITEFDLIDPENETNFKPGTDQVELNYSLETQDSGNKNLSLNSDVINETVHEEGLENYTKTLNELSSGLYEWNVTFESDSGNIFASNTSEFRIEETEVSIDLQNPQENQEISYPDREIDFNYEIESNEDANISLRLNDELKNNETISRNEEEQFTYNEELDPGSYDWNITVETETGEIVDSTSSFTVLEPDINLTALSPEENESLSYDDREVDFEFNLESEDSGEARLVINDSEEDSKTFEKGEEQKNFTKELDSGNYEWRIEATTDEGPENITDTRKLEIYPPTEVNKSKISPSDGENFAPSTEEVELEFEATANRSGDVSLILNEDEVFQEPIDADETLEHIETVSVNQEEYEWHLEYTSDAGELFETEKNGFVVEETDIELETTIPEESDEYEEEEEIAFEAEADVNDDFEITLLLEGNLIYSEELGSGNHAVGTVENITEAGDYEWFAAVETADGSIQETETIEFEVVEPEEEEEEESFEQPTEEPEEEESEELDIYIEEGDIVIENLELESESIELDFSEFGDREPQVNNLWIHTEENIDNQDIRIEETDYESDLIVQSQFELVSDITASVDMQIEFYSVAEWQDNMRGVETQTMSLFSDDEALESALIEGNDHNVFSAELPGFGEYTIGSRNHTTVSALNPTETDCRQIEVYNLPDDWSVISESCDDWETAETLRNEIEEIEENVETEEESQRLDEAKQYIEEGSYSQADEVLNEVEENVRESREASNLLQIIVSGIIGMFIIVLLIYLIRNTKIKDSKGK